MQVSVVQTYSPNNSNNNNATLSTLLFSFPVDDTVATIHFFEASVGDKLLVGNVVDKDDPAKLQSHVNENEKQFIPAVQLSKERDRFQVFLLSFSSSLFPLTSHGKL